MILTIILLYIVPLFGTIWLYKIQSDVLDVWCKEDSKPDWLCFCPFVNLLLLFILGFTSIKDYINPPYWSKLYKNDINLKL